MADLRRQVLDWFGQVMAHDFAEKKHIERAAMAKGIGFNPDQYARPFPGSVPSTTVVLETPVTPAGADPAKPVPPASPAAATSAQSGVQVPSGWSGSTKLGLATLLGAALAGGGGLVGSWLRGPTVSATAPVKPAEQELQIRWWVEDGKMKSVVEPVK